MVVHLPKLSSCVINTPPHISTLYKSPPMTPSSSSDSSHQSPDHQDNSDNKSMQQRLSRLSQLGSHLLSASSSSTTTNKTFYRTTASKMSSSTSAPNITLYTVNTPNGIKISMLLEELSLPYKVHPIDFSKNEQKEPWFLEINPNGRIPALTDTFTDGKPIHLFESGSILQYLVDRYDTEHKVSYPRESREYWEVNSWLHWQMGGLGPMQGQANHFARYAPEKIQYGIDRYQNETRRLYGVLEKQLEKSTSGYIVGDRLTIADIACWGWVAGAHWAGVSVDKFPKLNEWVERVVARPACEKGRHVPTRHTLLDSKHLSEEELDKKAESSRAWVQKGMAEDAKKK